MCADKSLDLSLDFVTLGNHSAVVLILAYTFSVEFIISKEGHFFFHLIYEMV